MKVVWLAIDWIKSGDAVAGKESLLELLNVSRKLVGLLTSLGVHVRNVEDGPYRCAIHIIFVSDSDVCMNAIGVPFLSKFRNGRTVCMTSLAVFDEGSFAAVLMLLQNCSEQIYSAYSWNEAGSFLILALRFCMKECLIS